MLLVFAGMLAFARWEEHGHSDRLKWTGIAIAVVVIVALAVLNSEAILGRYMWEPLAFLVPLRTGLFRWGLEEGLRLVKPMNLMALGEYQEPRGSWFPSVIY